MRQPKVFCIGFHKTTTSSLANALYILGYNLTGAPVEGFDYGSIRGAEPRVARERVWQYLPSVVDRRDAFQDTPWFAFFRELDAAYPGSKFILTRRDTEPWVESVVRHFGRSRIPDHEWIYGTRCAAGHEDVLARVYDDHNRAVLAHFQHRPDDLLVLDAGEGIGWDRLCAFLGFEIPPHPFPRVNQASAKDNRLRAKLVRAYRNRVKPRLGLDDDLRRSLRVWTTCHAALEAWEQTLGITPPRKTRRPFPHQVLQAVHLEALEEAYLRTGALRRFLGREVTALAPEENPERGERLWHALAGDLRDLVGGLSYQSIYTAFDGASVGRATVALCERLERAAPALEPRRSTRAAS